MKKLSWILVSSLLAIILLNGCSQAATSNDSEPKPAENSGSSANEKATEEAIKAAETYKLKEYTIYDIPETPLTEESITKRNEEMEPFFAEGFEEKPDNLSYISLTLRTAETQKASLKPENMKFTVYQEAENYLDLDYTMDLVLEKQSGDSERVPLEGRLTLVNQDGKWLVQADRIDHEAFLKLNPQE